MARSPSVEKVLGTASKCLSEERRVQIGRYGTKRFDMMVRVYLMLSMLKVAV